MDDKVDLKSLDIKKDKIEQLKKAFPEVVTEGKVDFERLKSELGEEIETGKERYEMKWPGKANLQKIIQEPSIGTLKPVKDASVDFDTTENLFIEGDSLEVLKLLQKSYYGKVKMIYIDPPYNTGNDFVYPDNYSESLDTYLRYTGQKGEEGLRLTTNAETEGRYHSKWMNMMYPRLYLARNLLSSEGFIFISIDDHEFHNLRKISDEIFGEENHITSFVWKKRHGQGKQAADNNLSVQHEYVVCYQANEGLKFKGEDRNRSAYTNPDNDPRGDWSKQPLDVGSTKDERPNCFYDLVDPDTGNVYPANPNRVWAFYPPSMEKLIQEKRIIFDPNGKNRPAVKKFWNDLKSEKKQLSSWINNINDETNDDEFLNLKSDYNTAATKDLNELFGKKIFDYPKPVSLIRNLIDQTTDHGDIILDFFAGSGTTAQAVFNNNSKDGKNRKWILVQLQEPTLEETEASRSGYKNIAQIGEERIRRVIKKIKDEISGKLEFENKKMDLGFKVFRLEESNFKIWDKKSDVPLQQQLPLAVSNIHDDSSDEEILYEIILKSGFELSVSVEKLEIKGKTVYSVDNKSLLICLENDLSQEFIKEVSGLEAQRVVFLDRGFSNNDQLKTNTVELMKAKSVEFKTV